MAAQSTADGILAALAQRQYGVVSRAQLLALGLTRTQITARLESGRLHALHRGVYAVGHRPRHREAAWLAAILACGEGAVLSHQSAAVLWRMADREGGLPHVTVRGRHRLPRIIVHEAHLTRRDMQVRFGIPVTSPARTLIDLAHALDADEFDRVAREAQYRNLFDVPALRDALQRRPASRVRRMLDDIAPTQSKMEDRMLRICRRYRLPQPRTQQWNSGRRIDFLWPEQRVAVEADSWEGHGTPWAFQADRDQSNALQLAGYVILRFTHADITRRPAHVAQQIRAALAGAGDARRRDPGAPGRNPLRSPR
jgi:very-short-patch-repair endonuclease